MVFRLQPWCSLLVVGVVVVLGVCAGVGEAIPPPLCYNQKLALTPYARRLCAALNDISRFSRAMEDYLDAQGELRHCPSSCVSVLFFRNPRYTPVYACLYLFLRIFSLGLWRTDRLSVCWFLFLSLSMDVLLRGRHCCSHPLFFSVSSSSSRLLE